MTEDLLQFLKNPDFYPHRSGEIKHIQTHISHVFMAYPYVYKFKKAVDFGFLDYSTLEKRRTFCEREVKLNRRLSEDIYLGVVAVSEKDGDYQLETEDPEPESVVEYAVKMRMLEEQYFLHHYIEEESLTEEHLDRVAEKLAQFYNSQKETEELSKWGAIESIKVNTDENFEQTEEFIGRTIGGSSFEAIKFFTNEYFRQHEELFRRRIDEGRIVDGHGDLHLDHIHITPEKVQIYDCIEFNDRFRYGDLAADLAFLAMDLDFNGCHRHERYFVQKMAEKLNDNELIEIIDFYKCYRAYVKGKVKSLQSAEEEVPEEDRKKSAETAARYFDLSLRYALLGSKPIVLVFIGRVGTGKSTLSEHLSDKLGINRFSSDRIRKSLADLPLTERTPESKRKELYSKEMSKRTYAQLREAVKKVGEEGDGVVLDATFSSREERRRLMETLESTGVDYLFVEACAPDEVIKNRLKSRDEKDDVVSDARLEDFEQLVNSYDPPREISPLHFMSVNTAQPIKESIRELYRKLAERNLNQNTV